MNQTFYKSLTFISFVLTLGFVVESGNIFSKHSKKEKSNYVIIDTDAGVDDGLALMYAFDYHKRGLVKILAVTCSFGNTNVDQVVKNVLQTRKAMGTEDIKVYRGADSPLLSREGHYDDFYGSDAFGNASYSLPPINAKIEDEHAAIAIKRLVKKHPKQITMVTLAPLTNLALAMQLDPKLADDLHQIISIGGLIDMIGWVLPTTELNFYNDPEAVHLVLEKSTCPLYIITFDECLKNIITMEQFKSITAKETPRTKFLHKITELIIKRDGEVNILCDILAVIGAVRPDLVLKWSEYPVAMELSGNYTRGTLVVNRSTSLKFPFPAQRKSNFTLDTDNKKIISSIDEILHN